MNTALWSVANTIPLHTEAQKRVFTNACLECILYDRKYLSARLPRRVKEAIVTCRAFGLTPGDIARMTGLRYSGSVSTIIKNRHKWRQKPLERNDL